MKKLLFLMAFVALLGSQAYALRYDLQPYTSCQNGLCSTSLDVSVLGLSQNKINSLKAVNITNFLTKSGAINNFAYAWNGNTITITGRVNENVYWSFSAAGDTFDPWWNYTKLGYFVPNSASNILAYPMDENTGTDINDQSGNNLDGTTTGAWITGKYDTAINITGNKPIITTNDPKLNITGGSFTIMYWAKMLSCPSTWKVMSQWGAEAPYRYAVYHDNTCPPRIHYRLVGSLGTIDLTGSLLSLDTWYHVVIMRNNSGTYGYLNGANDGVSTSATGNFYTAANWYWGSNSANEDFRGIIDEVKVFNTSLSETQITAEMNTAIRNETNVSFYWTANLYLNGNETNITLVNSTALNITGLTNVSSFNVSLYLNSTFVGSGLGNATNISFLGAGLYNITAWFGNASTNTSITYWADMTLPVAPIPLNYSYVINIDLNNAPAVCLNATRILRYTNFNNQAINESYECPYGCNNITLSCESPVYQQNLITIGVFLAAFAGIFFIISRVKKRRR